MCYERMSLVEFQNLLERDPYDYASIVLKAYYLWDSGDKISAISELNNILKINQSDFLVECLIDAIENDYPHMKTDNFLLVHDENSNMDSEKINTLYEVDSNVREFISIREKRIILIRVDSENNGFPKAFYIFPVGLVDLPFKNFHKSSMLHELMHIYRPSSNRFFMEGLAVYFQSYILKEQFCDNVSNFNGAKGILPIDEYLKEFSGRIRLFSDNNTNLSEKNTAYYIAGETVSSIIDCYGKEKFLEFYDSVSRTKDINYLKDKFYEFFNVDITVFFSSLIDKINKTDKDIQTDIQTPNEHNIIYSELQELSYSLSITEIKQMLNKIEQSELSEVERSKALANYYYLMFATKYYSFDYNIDIDKKFCKQQLKNAKKHLIELEKHKYCSLKEYLLNIMVTFVLNVFETNILSTISNMNEVKKMLDYVCNTYSYEINVKITQGYILMFTPEKYGGSIARAIDFFNECLIQDENSLEALLWKGVALYYLGKYDDALSVIDKTLSIKENFQQAKYFKVKIEESMGI